MCVFENYVIKDKPSDQLLYYYLKHALFGLDINLMQGIITIRSNE